MARGKYLSLQEARKQGKLDRFGKEHPSVGDNDQLDQLFDAMAGQKPGKPRRVQKASKSKSNIK